MRLNAHELLRKVLAAAKISVNIDPGLLPVTTQFAAEESQRQDTRPGRCGRGDPDPQPAGAPEGRCRSASTGGMAW